MSFGLLGNYAVAKTVLMTYELWVVIMLNHVRCFVGYGYNAANDVCDERHY